MTVDTGRFNELITQVRACTQCSDELPLGPRPIVQASPSSVILIAGQAPGSKVHASGVPFDDASGDRLRDWLGVDASTFYDAERFAILPMAFCYPGAGTSGDLPPLTRCAANWRQRLLAQLSNVQLTLLVGQYAQNWHLPESKENLTARVRDWRRHWPDVLSLPHPSPRNNPWLKKNNWFARDVLPVLRTQVRALVDP